MLGIFGGTFNPPHRGHVAVARHARAELGLARVLLMPACMSPHKGALHDPGAAHRLRMCELAVAGEDGLEVSALEIERGGPSYTVDTLSAIHERDPDVELTFIVGADTAATLGSWREPARLLALADLAVAARSGSDRARVLDTIAAIGAAHAPAPEGGVRFLEMDAIEVSSSIVRDRVARGEPIDGLVSPAVADYISEHGLYRANVAAAL